MTQKKYPTCPEFPHFGAQYPDATCIDGQLHDLDRCDDEGNLYAMDEYDPCPFCRTEDYIERYIDEESGMTRDEILLRIDNTYNKWKP